MIKAKEKKRNITWLPFLEQNSKQLLDFNWRGYKYSTMFNLYSTS